jgi:hypothetical protein
LQQTLFVEDGNPQGGCFV